MTKRKTIAKLIAYALFLAGSVFLFLFHNAGVTFAVLLGTAVLPCLFTLFAFLQNRFLSFSAELEEGLSLRLSALPLPAFLRVRFTVKNVFSGEEEKEEKLLFLFGKSSVYFSLPDRSGKREVAMELCTLDAFGFFSFRVGKNFSGESLRLPKEREISLLPRASENTFESLSLTYRDRVDGSERSSFHSYREGEPVKDVHWKLSARMDELMLSDHSTPVYRGVALLLDDKEEGSLSFAFSLSYALQKANIPHSLFFLSDRQELCEREVSEKEDVLFIEKTFLSSPFRQGVESRFFAFRTGYARVYRASQAKEKFLSEVEV